MDDAQRIIPARRPPRFQFNLKFMLAVTTLCAIAAAVAGLGYPAGWIAAIVILVIGSVVLNVGCWGWHRTSVHRNVLFCAWTAYLTTVTFLASVTVAISACVAALGWGAASDWREAVRAVAMSLSCVAAVVAANIIVYRQR